MILRKKTLLTVFGLFVLFLASSLFLFGNQQVSAANPDGCTHEYVVKTTPDGGRVPTSESIPRNTEQLAIEQSGGCVGQDTIVTYWFAYSNLNEGDIDYGYNFHSLRPGASDMFYFTETSSAQNATYSSGPRGAGGREKNVAINNPQLAQNFLENEVQTDDDNVGAAPGSEGEANNEEGSDEPECEAQGSFMSWAVCDAVIWALDVIENAEQFIMRNLLDVDPISFDDRGPLYQIWNSFRIIANALFIIAFLIIIFSQAASINIDAYSIKRIIPRLLIAVIMVQLSYFVSALVIDGMHVLGNGLNDLVDNILTDNNTTIQGVSALKGMSGAAAVLLGAGGLAYAGIAGTSGASISAIVGTLGPILMFGLLAILAVLIVIALREIFILMAVVLSPIAFVAYLLPSTEKWFKFWWSNFARLLLMYPFMVLMIQMGKVGAYIALSGGGFMSVVMAFIMQLASLFFIVFAFKISGSAMLAVSNLMSKGRKMGEKQTQKSIEKRRSLADERKANVAQGQGVDYEGESFAGLKNATLGRLSRTNWMKNKAAGASNLGWLGTDKTGRVGDTRYGQSKAQRNIADKWAEASKQGEEDLQRQGLDDPSGTNMMLYGENGLWDGDELIGKGYNQLYGEAETAGNVQEMDRLKKQWERAKFYRTTGAGRLAATKNAAKLPGMNGEGVRRATKAYFGDSGTGADAFSKFAVEAKDKHPHELRRNYHTGNIDTRGVAEDVSGKPPEELAKMSGKAWDAALEGMKDPGLAPEQKVPDKTLHSLIGGGDKAPMVSPQNANKIEDHLIKTGYLDKEGKPPEGDPYRVNMEQVAGQNLNPPDQGDIPVREQGQQPEGGDDSDESVEWVRNPDGSWEPKK